MRIQKQARKPRTDDDKGIVFTGSPYELMQIIGSADDARRSCERNADFNDDQYTHQQLEKWRNNELTTVHKEHGHYEATDTLDDVPQTDIE